MQDRFHDKGEDVVTGDAKKGMVRVKLVTKAKMEHALTLIEKMRVFTGWTGRRRNGAG